MSRPPKPAAQAKKVPPPAVPHEFRHSGSSFGSAGYASSEDTAFLAAPEPPGVPRGEKLIMAFQNCVIAIQNHVIVYKWKMVMRRRRCVVF